MGRNNTFSLSKLRAASIVCHAQYWPSEPETAAADSIGGYRSEGYIGDLHYKQTLSGLKKWTIDYLRVFPRFRAMSTNCQKYNIGAYNAITHSHRPEDQNLLSTVGGAVSSALGSMIQGSVVASSSSIGSSTPQPRP